MPTRTEIIQKANEEYSRITAECQAATDEVRAQQNAALSTIPEAAAALERHSRSIQTAASECSAREADLRQVSADAEQQAQRVQFNEQSDALTQWQRATAAADESCAIALRDAERAFDDACNAAMHLVLDARDTAIARARASREAARRSAQGQCDREKTAALREHEASVSAAREKAISAVGAARERELSGRAEAQSKREGAEREATEALVNALAFIPLASPIQEAFALRLQEISQRCEADKADVLDRMRDELAGR